MLRPLNNIIPFLICILLIACTTTKHVPEGDKLYIGADVNLKSTGLTARENRVLEKDLQNLTRPKPNTRFLGMPVKLAFYNMFYKSKPNSFFGRIRDKFGEPPVLLSSVDLTHNTQILQNHLENKGFFKAKVTGDTTVRRKKARAVYEAVSGDQYHINSVVFDNDSSILTQNIQLIAGQTLLKPGSPYDLDLIKGERIRIDNTLKERGFYYFSPDYLIVRVDSTIGGNLVDMRVNLKTEAPEVAKEIYRINNVYIYSNYNLGTAAVDTNKANMQFFEGYYVIDNEKRFKPKLFAQAMQFNPGDVYNRTDHNLTLSRLINLNEFKFVKNRFEAVEDSAKLNAYYYLTPLPKKSLKGEITGITRSNNLNGIQLSGTWMHRNIFRAGEHFILGAYTGTEVQFGGTFKGYNTYRSGASIDLSIPRFFVPLTDIRTRGGFVPRTHVKLAYDLLNKRKLYTLNSFRFGFGYEWQETIKKRHEFYPLNVTYVQPINVTQEYRDSIAKYPYLNNIIDSQFVLGITYQYNYNDLASAERKIHSFYFNGLIDLAGNVAGLLTGGGDVDKPKKLFNAVYDQYIKLEADGRFYKQFGLFASWANRLVIGYGLPHGNSIRMPYIKQFFSGGTNSIRAFRSRSLLGAYRFPDTSGFYPDQTGDIKLEFNSEYRPRISGPLYGALFVDIGNTWLKNADSTRPGAHFTKDFIKQLAIGAGVGVRLDIQLFVIRFDVAFPIRKPWETEVNKDAFKSGNIIYNLAIGYPF